MRSVSYTHLADQAGIADQNHFLHGEVFGVFDGHDRAVDAIYYILFFIQKIHPLYCWDLESSSPEKRTKSSFCAASASSKV